MTIVAVSGYFDPLHVGHLEYFEMAKQLGNKLIVIVNNDKQAILKKGESFMNENDRVEIIGALKCVDEVFLSIDEDKSVCKSLEAIKPDIFANGGDRSDTSKILEYETAKKYNIEFVSANPTGPLHVGHCRGAILGDVLSNLLSFNGHKVSKEYYVNDYGNQISHFVYSIYLRIREKLNGESFPTNNNDLYPGDYLIDIADSIIEKNKNLKFDNFELIKDKLKELSVKNQITSIKEKLKHLKAKIQKIGK